MTASKTLVGVKNVHAIYNKRRSCHTHASILCYSVSVVKLYYLNSLWAVCFKNVRLLSLFCKVKIAK